MHIYERLFNYSKFTLCETLFQEFGGNYELSSDNRRDKIKMRMFDSL